MIIRAKRTHGYSVLPNLAFEDDRLSYEARGLLGYLLVKRDDWRVSITNLQRAGAAGRRKGQDVMGRDRIYGLLDELIEYGYVTREQPRTAGKVGRMNYVVRDEPLPGNPYTANPYTANPYAENPDALTSTDTATSTEDDKVLTVNGLPAAPDAAGAPLDADLPTLNHGQAVRAATDQPGKPAKNGREPKPPRSARGGAALLGPGAVVYRDVVHLTPNHVQRVTLDDALAAHGEARMRAVLADWLGRGYSPKNVTGMVDAMAHGLNGYARNGNGRAAPDFSQVIL